MPQGLIQVVATGKQDEILTGKPQITFFENQYKQYTNFAIEAISQTFTGAVDFGKTVTATIDRNGDLIHRMWLEIQLPAISATASNTVAWVPHVGHIIISEARIDIGGLTIDTHYGQLMTIWHELTTPASQFDNMLKMIGYTSKLTTPAAAIAAATLNVPLKFWFCEDTAQALPLSALQYHDVKVYIKFRNWTDLIVNPDKVAGTPVLGDTLLYVDYVYLTEEERARFAKHPHEYLVTLTNRLEDSTSSNLYRGNLGFNHPVRELIWTVQPNSNTDDGANRWTDFTASGTNTALAYQAGNPVLSAELSLSGATRFSKRSGDYFNKVQPYQHHTRGPAEGINVYSFCLNPESSDPNGSMNFSRIDNAQLTLNLSTNAPSRVTVYDKHFNILRVVGGLAGLAFAN